MLMVSIAECSLLRSDNRPAGRSIMVRNTILAPVVILLTLPAALCAEPDAPAAKEFNPDSFGTLSLLRDASVLKSLDLSDVQRQSLDDVQTDWAKEFDSFGRLGVEERQNERENLGKKMRSFEKLALAIFSDEQRKQLDAFQRRRRWRIISPLTRLDGTPLQDELRLTNAQRAAVQGLQEQWVEECERLFREKTGSEWGPSDWDLLFKIKPKYEKLRDDLIRDTLTEEQQERLRGNRTADEFDDGERKRTRQA